MIEAIVDAQPARVPRLQFWNARDVLGRVEKIVVLTAELVPRAEEPADSQRFRQRVEFVTVSSREKIFKALFVGPRIILLNCHAFGLQLEPRPFNVIPRVAWQEYVVSRLFVLVIFLGMENALEETEADI